LLYGDVSLLLRWLNNGRFKGKILMMFGYHIAQEIENGLPNDFFFDALNVHATPLAV